MVSNSQRMRGRSCRGFLRGKHLSGTFPQQHYLNAVGAVQPREPTSISFTLYSDTDTIDCHHSRI